MSTIKKARFCFVSFTVQPLLCDRTQRFPVESEVSLIHPGEGRPQISANVLDEV